MSVIRSVTTRLASEPNIEFRVGVHTPRTSSGIPDPEKPAFAVVEVYHRSAEYEMESGQEWKQIARYRMDEFVEVARDVARIGKELLPKRDDDEASTDEPD